MVIWLLEWDGFVKGSSTYGTGMGTCAWSRPPTCSLQDYPCCDTLTPPPLSYVTPLKTFSFFFNFIIFL